MVYALLRDALYLTEANGKVQFQRHDVSQLVTIDVSDVAHPRILKTLDIIGQLHEGVSRKIDSTIYVVSEQFRRLLLGLAHARPDDEAQAWVYSYDVSDPTNPRQVGQLPIFEGGERRSRTDANGNLISSALVQRASRSRPPPTRSWSWRTGTRTTTSPTRPAAIRARSSRWCRSSTSPIRRAHPPARALRDRRHARRPVQDDLPVRRRHRPGDVLRHLLPAVLGLHRPGR